jgi:hypothetical protein
MTTSQASLALVGTQIDQLWPERVVAAAKEVLGRV